MPIHDQGYRRYTGQRTRHDTRWTVIARAGIRSMLGRRNLIGIMALAWMPFLVHVVRIYVTSSVPQAAFLAPGPDVLRGFLDQQRLFVFFVTIYVGAGLIADDRRANALQIYLSKPLTGTNYIIGKLAIVMTFLLLITWVPTLLLLVVQMMAAGSLTFLGTHLFLVPSITVFSWLEALVASLAMLALSSLSNSSRMAAVLYTALLFFSEAIVRVLGVVTGGSRFTWISLPADLEQVGNAIFRMPPTYAMAWGWSLGVVIVVMALAVVVLNRRVRGVEVVA